MKSFNEDDIDINEIKELTEKLAEYIPVVFTTMGSKGLLVSTINLSVTSFKFIQKITRLQERQSRMDCTISLISKEVFQVSVK